MRCIVFEDNGSLNIYIYLIITTYFFNKNGFSCVCLFFSLLSLLLSRSSSFLLPFSNPVPYQFFLFFLWIYPQLASKFGLGVHLLYHYTTVIC